ncbi:hypothetical protein HaLaN_22072 [Haematococcus lacustris]|uniref:Uncharacterized protein n=1 Tax=Haematococcus lacustris TaxID=44745 RepID=A0A699ZZN4_HAELA|nr:hypothetical protein HaLaN_22072 [Haematococcus lacustris]
MTTTASRGYKPTSINVSSYPQNYHASYHGTVNFFSCIGSLPLLPQFLYRLSLCYTGSVAAGGFNRGMSALSDGLFCVNLLPFQPKHPRAYSFNRYTVKVM